MAIACSVTVSMQELTMGIFSLMCLLKRLARSTLSVGKLMKPTHPLELTRQTIRVLSSDYLFRSFRLRSLSQNVILTHTLQSLSIPGMKIRSSYVQVTP